MRILVCVKRVPMTGGKIVLTRGRAEDRDEAPRLHDQPARGVRRRGGRPPRRGERRRVGRPHARARRGRGAAPRRDGARRRPRDPPRHGRRGVGPAGDGRVRSSMRSARTRAAHGPFDLVFFGNESADCRRLSGRDSRGARPRPTGRDRAQGRCRSRTEPSAASRRSPAGATSTSCRCRRSSPFSKACNLPRYPSVPGETTRPAQAARQPRARPGPVRSSRCSARRTGGTGQGGRDPRPRSRGRARGRRGAAGGSESRDVILVCVEARASYEQALAFAHTLGEAVHAFARRRCTTFSASRRSTSQNTRRSPPTLRSPSRALVELVGARAVRSRRGRHRARQRGPGARRREARPAVRGELRVSDTRRPDAAHTNAVGRKPPRGGRAARRPEAPDSAAARRRRRTTLRRGAERRALHAELSDADIVVRVARPRRAASGGVSLSDAKVVVSAGRGAGSPEGFGIIEELAGLLGGAVGCSRAVTMSGWRPHTDQVGQTGTKIAPDIYIACGISGATQHMAGCKGAKAILAVNTDPEAPILASADYAVIGDLHEVVPAISAELRKAGGS